MKFLTATISNAGGRNINQDDLQFVLLNTAACWVVADGLGGHRGGESASRIAVKKILTSFKSRPILSPEAIKQHLNSANNSILKLQEENPDLFSMRTTVTLLISDYNAVLWAHIGDSRLYHFRSGRIIFQTKDHSVPQALAAAGDIRPDEIRFHEDRNRLLHSLGQKGELRPTILQQKQPLQRGDAFLLCTDGFWEYVTETEMEVDFAMANHPNDWLKRMEKRILERARAEFDNYSATAVFVENAHK